MFREGVRLILCMKKLFLLTTIFLGTVAASQAGVHFSFGVNVPLPGEMILGQSTPAPCPVPAAVISQPAPLYQPAPEPVYAPPPVCSQPSPVVTQPVYCPPTAPVYCPPTPAVVCAPQVVIAPRPRYYGHEHAFYAYRHDHWDRDAYRRHGGWR